MNEILCNFGELRIFENMTTITMMVSNIFASWISAGQMGGGEKAAARYAILKSCVIYVTSQDRGEGSHINGNAVDIAVWSNDSLTGELKPSPLLLVIAGELSSYGLFCAVSTYNYHIHIERGRKGLMAENLYLSGFRVPPRLYTDDEIKKYPAKRNFEPLDSEIFNVLTLYRGFPSNSVTDYILAYFRKSKIDYDAYYKKMFPDGFTPFWELASLSPQATANHINNMKNDFFGVSKNVLVFAGALLVGYIIWKNV